MNFKQIELVCWSLVFIVMAIIAVLLIGSIQGCTSTEDLDSSWDGTTETDEDERGAFLYDPPVMESLDPAE